MTFFDRFKLGFALSIIAGLFIGIAGFGYLAVGGIPGAILFAFGLIGVVSYKCKLFTGTASNWTMITAAPKPAEVDTFLDTAKKVHIPKKKAKAMFSTKTLLMKREI